MLQPAVRAQRDPGTDEETEVGPDAARRLSGQALAPELDRTPHAPGITDDGGVGKPDLDLAVGMRPPRELYDIRKDPGCLQNLAEAPSHATTHDTLHSRLTTYLKQTHDPRITNNGDIWETYPRTSRLRWFPIPSWAKTSPNLPKQPWLEQRRPRK